MTLSTQPFKDIALGAAATGLCTAVGVGVAAASSLCFEAMHIGARTISTEALYQLATCAGCVGAVVGALFALIQQISFSRSAATGAFVFSSLSALSSGLTPLESSYYIAVIISLFSLAIAAAMMSVNKRALGAGILLISGSVLISAASYNRDQLRLSARATPAAY